MTMTALATPTTHALPRGPARDALCAAVAALDTAERDATPMQHCEALVRVARCYRDLGSAAHAEAYLQQALRWAQTLGASDPVVDLLCELAEVAADRAELPDARERARDHAFEAARQARHAADRHWEVTVLLRLADVLDHCGDHGDAITLQCRALGLIVHDAGVPASPQAGTPAALM